MEAKKKTTPASPDVTFQKGALILKISQLLYHCDIDHLSDILTELQQIWPFGKGEEAKAGQLEKCIFAEAPASSSNIDFSTECTLSKLMQAYREYFTADELPRVYEMLIERAKVERWEKVAQTASKKIVFAGFTRRGDNIDFSKERVKLEILKALGNAPKNYVLELHRLVTEEFLPVEASV